MFQIFKYQYARNLVPVKIFIETVLYSFTFMFKIQKKISVACTCIMYLIGVCLLIIVYSSILQPVDASIRSCKSHVRSFRSNKLNTSTV